MQIVLKTIAIKTIKDFKAFKDYYYTATATWNEQLFQHRSSLFTTLQEFDYHCCTCAASVKSCTQCYQARPHNAVNICLVTWPPFSYL